MARTVLLLALALAPAAHALGITKPPLCTCAAKEEDNVCDIAGECDTFPLPFGQCDDLLLPDTVNVPCTGVFTCLPNIGWDFVATGESCEGTEYDCEEVQKGKWIEPLAGECCGKCCFGTPEDCDFSLP